MSDKLEELKSLIGQLKEVAELNRDAATAALEESATEDKPVRKGEPQTELVGPEGAKAFNPVVKEGKYAGMKTDDLQLVHMIMDAGHRARPSVIAMPSPELVKALTSSGSGTGDELVPDAWATSLWSDFFTASKVAGSLGAPISMPADPFEIPLELGDVTWYKGAENTASTATDTATSKSQMISTEQICEVNWSYTLDEDAVVAMLPTLRARLAISGAEQIDYFILNADATGTATGNINSDDTTPATTKSYLSAGQDGIRHQWLVDYSSMTYNAGGDALEDSDIIGALAKMDKYAVDLNNLRMYTGFSEYVKGLMDLDACLTVDKYGPSAVVLTGELGRYRGIPIIVSASHDLCEADGKISKTAGNNTLGSISIAHAPSWNYGFRRTMLLEVDKNIQQRKMILVLSFRIALAAFGTRSSAQHTSGIRNILVS